MLKLLLKKQLFEIFSPYFYDAKKNKARSKASTVMFFVLFALLIVGLLGGIFTFLAIGLCRPLASANLSWLYFALMGGIAILLGAFGSVFNTYAGLYLPKDNDLLLSIDPQQIEKDTCTYCNQRKGYDYELIPKKR